AAFTATATPRFAEFLVAGSSPQGIGKGTDGNIWFTESSDKIGRITPSGTVTEFPLPSSGGGTSLPLDIVAGPDGGPRREHVVHGGDRQQDREDHDEREHRRVRFAADHE